MEKCGNLQTVRGVADRQNAQVLGCYRCASRL